MLTRRLALKRETLAALTAEDMAAVAGGASEATCVTCLDCIYIRDISQNLTNCFCNSPTLHCSIGGAAAC